MKTMILVILTAAITNNYVLVKFLGICPFLGVSKKLDQATGMSLAVIFVEVLATAVTWPIYHFLLAGKRKPPSVTPRTITKIGRWTSTYKRSLRAGGRKEPYEKGLGDLPGHRHSGRIYAGVCKTSANRER